MLRRKIKNGRSHEIGLEDLEALYSPTYLERILQARQDKVRFSSDLVKRQLRSNSE